eukprot:c21326_g1_i1 orf=320-568(+)
MMEESKVPLSKSGSSPCSALKTAYNECFNRWYTEKFLKGKWEEEDCVLEWEAYHTCILKRMEERKLSHYFRIESSLHPKDKD